MEHPRGQFGPRNLGKKVLPIELRKRELGRLQTAGVAILRHVAVLIVKLSVHISKGFEEWWVQAGPSGRGGKLQRSHLRGTAFDGS
jgi:hypothetical protein